MVPDEDVEALDLLDQKDNCPACGGYLETRVLLEARTPSPQLFELVRAEPSLLHRPTLLARLTRCEPQRECADRAPRTGCRRPGSTPGSRGPGTRHCPRSREGHAAAHLAATCRRDRAGRTRSR